MRKAPIIFAGLLVLLAVGGWLVFRNDSAENQLGTGPEYDIALPAGAPPTSFDPVKLLDLESIAYAVNIHSALAIVQQDGSFRYLIAERMEMSSDAMSATIHVHPAARFWSGEAVTSSDVAASFERFRKSAHPYRWIFDLVKGVVAFDANEQSTLEGLEIVDDRTLRVHFMKPDPDFLNFISGSAMMITRKQSHDAPTKEFDLQLIGCGPYMPDQAEPGVKFTFRRNPGFPISSNIRTITMRVVEHSQQQLSEVQAGALSIMRLRGPMLGEALRADQQGQAVVAPEFADKLRLYHAKCNDLLLVAIGWKSPTLRNIAVEDRARFRATLFNGLDRATLAQSMYLGFATPAYSVVPPLFHHGHPQPHQNRSSIPSSELELVAANDAESRRVADVVAGHLRKQGFSVRVTLLDNARFVQRLVSGDFDLAACWFEVQMRGGYVAWLNFFAIGNPLAKALGQELDGVGDQLLALRSSSHDQQRQEGFAALAAKVDQAQSVWAPLFSRDVVLLADKRLDGVVLDSVGTFYTFDLRISDSSRKP